MIDFLISFDFWQNIVPETYKERPTSVIRDIKDYLAEHHQNIKVHSVDHFVVSNTFKIKVSQDTPELTFFRIRYSEYFYVD